MFIKEYKIKAVPASRPKIPRYGHPYYPKRYTEFRKRWLEITKPDWPAIQAEMENTEEYEFSFEFWCAKHAKSDLDNVAKALEDELVKAGVILDDNLIVVTRARKHFNAGYDAIKIFIRRIK